jgi:hypothetical protein
VALGDAIRGTLTYDRAMSRVLTAHGLRPLQAADLIAAKS